MSPLTGTEHRGTGADTKYREDVKRTAEYLVLESFV